MARTLLPGQRAELFVADVAAGTLRLVYRSDRMLFEAPNWTPDGRFLVVNADGGLWRLPADGTAGPEPVDLAGVPPVNNDHLVLPSGAGYLVSADDGHIHLVDGRGGARRVTDSKEPARAFRHFLHGVSADGTTIAYVGTERADGDDWALRRVFTRALTGGPDVLVGDGFSPADGPEFGPDGMLYLNSEVGTGTAQLFRCAPDGSGLVRLTDDDRVNWFPHPSPDGRHLAYVSFPPGTAGHPENVDVLVRLCAPDGTGVRDVAAVFGGQGTMNVPSWAPDSERFAFVAYPAG
ncbi:MAG TPA: hypothetical protein VGN37_29325 [Actinocatenispora sp.]